MVHKGKGTLIFLCTVVAEYVIIKELKLHDLSPHITFTFLMVLNTDQAKRQKYRF